jgi:hypothetical protein
LAEAALSRKRIQINRKQASRGHRMQNAQGPEHSTRKGRKKGTLGQGVFLRRKAGARGAKCESRTAHDSLMIYKELINVRINKEEEVRS